MSQKSAEMKAQGIDVINLSVGEPDFNTPDHIKAAAHQAIDDNYSRYSPVPGYADLRQAVADKLKNENALDYTPNRAYAIPSWHSSTTATRSSFPHPTG